MKNHAIMGRLSRDAQLERRRDGRFSRYMRRLFAADPRAYFRPWPIERILLEYAQWSAKPRRLYMCLRAPAQTTSSGTQFKCVSDPTTAPLNARKGQAMRTIMYVELPPIRNWDAGHLEDECRPARGQTKRARKLALSASQLGLKVHFSTQVFDENSKHYNKDLAVEFGNAKEENAKHK